MEDDAAHEAERRRIKEGERTKMAQKVAQGGQVLPGDFLLHGGTGMCIWRPSLCKDEEARAFILNSVFAWQQDAPNTIALYTRSYLLTGEHGLTRNQLKLVPERVRAQTREALGVVEITEFAYFSVDEYDILDRGRME